VITRRLLVDLSFLLLMSAPAAGDDFASALESAREAARAHRYHDVIELLTPFNATTDPEIQYITAAEIGRAYFHLGQYQLAHRAFRQAVRIHPELVETAVYLEATSYLVGDTAQAFAILTELLRGGARDLYLAVTLPGERRFLDEPEVQSILDRHSVPLEIDVERGALLGVALGVDRETAVAALAAVSADPNAPALTASAGPALIWAFVFDSDRRLAEIIVQAENLVRYTPYRLQLGPAIDWRAAPATVIASWGQPATTAVAADGGVSMTWEHQDYDLTLDFATPRQPRFPGISEGAAMLRSVHLERRALEGTANMSQ
jgi:tetratricopeptide (TPR) repeat protein